LDLDELYERKQVLDEKKLNIYNKILGRVHNRVRLTSRQRVDEQFCWYVIPEILVGVAHYDHAECTKHILHQLRTNGFEVAYTHPNLMLVSWANWVPGYVRQEIKRQTGVKVDSKGEIVVTKQDGERNRPERDLLNIKTTSVSGAPDVPDAPDDMMESNQSKHRDVKSRTPSRKSIYSMDMFTKN
jgi:hypothetical protein